MNPTRRTFLASAAGLAALAVAQETKNARPLTAWNDGASRKAIENFVTRISTPDGPDFVPPAERIAVFDNDGTLWCEQPMYVQLAFVLDRIRFLADTHPEWKSTQPFKAVLDNDLAAVAEMGERGLVDLAMASHAGMTTEEFEQIVRDWIATARHPKFQRPYTECVYLPMLQLLSFLRASDFKTYIVSGGGVEFMRPWAEAVYGVPPEQVIGSSIKTKYEEREGKPILVRLPEIDFIDDKAGKPVGIHKAIGRRPVMAFGNSDGDYEMLRYTTAGNGPRFGLLIHHTDAEREYAYDRKSPFGRLNRGLDDAAMHGWVVVDTRKDWKNVFAFEA